MSGTCIFLAGAPEADQLRWDDDDLEASFATPIKRYLVGGTLSSAAPQSQASTAAHAPVKWRAVPMSNRAHDARLSSPQDVPQTQFVSFEQDRAGAGPKEKMRFLEHSLAVLDELDSSQIAGPEETSTFLSTYSFATDATGTSFNTSNNSFEYPSTSPAKLQSARGPLQIRGDISDLKRIPPADHITRIHPQTMTVNLLASVITVSPSRTVRLRKRAGEMDIMELLIGDETRAGFSISFWLAPADSQAKQVDDLRSSLLELRAGDVLLVQNVALSAFKGCVYGQSLSRRFARNSTVMSVIPESGGLPMHLRGKSDRVQKWASNFVGRAAVPMSSGKSGLGGEELPPDTQESMVYG